MRNLRNHCAFWMVCILCCALSKVLRLLVKQPFQSAVTGAHARKMKGPSLGVRTLRHQLDTSSSTKRCAFGQMPRVLPIGQMRCAFGQMRKLVKCALQLHVQIDLAIATSVENASCDYRPNYFYGFNFQGPLSCRLHRCAFTICRSNTSNYRM